MPLSTCPLIPCIMDQACHPWMTGHKCPPYQNSCTPRHWRTTHLVKGILNLCHKDVKLEYLIEREGYSHEEQSWILACDSLTCQQFHTMRPEKPDPRLHFPENTAAWKQDHHGQQFPSLQRHVYTDLNPKSAHLSLITLTIYINWLQTQTHCGINTQHLLHDFTKPLIFLCLHIIWPVCLSLIMTYILGLSACSVNKPL